MSTWSFVHLCDTQPGSPRSYRYRPALLEHEAAAYAQVRAAHPELILVGGDLTRDGVLHDFELREAKARLDAIGIPWHAIPGNMDVGNRVMASPASHAYRHAPEWTVSSARLARFAELVGDFPWSFCHRGVRFTGVYAAVAGSGLPEEARFWAFMEGLAALPRVHHHVLVMHYAPFINQPDEPSFDATQPDQYIAAYFTLEAPVRQRFLAACQRAGVGHIFSGHIHCRRPVQVFDGIRFYKSPATSFAQWADRWPDGDGTLGFTICEVSDAGITPRFVPLQPLSARADSYGPGGHPSPGQRDYRLAWER